MQNEITTERLRPNRSAMMPVGTSQMRTADSITVPTRTSSSGLKPTVLTKYSETTRKLGSESAASRKRKYR
ncbi:MAG: hypothetical protein H0U03_11035 [Actinobacteria bacterium]|nr:hypothetical protein [Actinomycetota bacterium]